MTSRLCDTIPTRFSDQRRREAHITIELALYQPEIAQNTGSMLRLCACFGVRMHIIHPTGFPFSRRALKRGGLDYVEHADFVEHDDFAAFESWREAAGRRLELLTTKAAASAYAGNFEPTDILMVGRESAGVREAVAQRAGLRLRIPMREGLRSLNVATAASLVLGEALRQTGYFETIR